MKYDTYSKLAVFFFVLQLLILLRNQILGDHIIFIYFCDHIPLLFAIGFHFRNIQFIKSLINVGLVLQSIYILDLLSYLFFGIFITGTTEYLFSNSYSTVFAILITLLMHITVPIALYYTYKEKIKLISLVYSLGYLIVLFLSSFFLTPIGYDINCVFNACGVSLLQFELFTPLYILIGFVLWVLPGYGIQKGLNYVYEQRKKIPKYFKSKNFYLGCYFLFVQAVILAHTPITNLENLNIYIWFCNHTPLLFALAFFTNKIQVIKSLICVGFIPQLIWVIDLLSRFILGYHILNYTNYLWEREITGIVVAVLIHLGTTFVALYYTYKNKVEKEAHVISVAYALILFFTTILFTDVVLNVNCIQSVCGLESITPPFFSTIWPIYAMALMFVPVLLLQQSLYRFFGGNK